MYVLTIIIFEQSIMKRPVFRSDVLFLYPYHEETLSQLHRQFFGPKPGDLAVIVGYLYQPGRGNGYSFPVAVFGK